MNIAENIGDINIIRNLTKPGIRSVSLTILKKRKYWYKRGFKWCVRKPKEKQSDYRKEKYPSKGTG